MSHRLAVLLGLVLAAGRSGAVEPPVIYPQFDGDDAPLMLVVATMEAGGDLPEFPECQREEFVCLDPSPFWMRTRVMDVVSGELAEEELAVASTSHYGIPENDGKPYLIRLITDGRHFVMPRYNRLLLYRAGGEYFFPLSETPVRWLPCSVHEIGQEVPQLRTPRDLRITARSCRMEEVRAHPEWFAPQGKDFYPRYWVSVSRLRTHLATHADEASSCNAR